MMVIALLFFTFNGYAQEDSLRSFNPYRVNKKVETPIIAIGYTFFIYQSIQLDSHANLSPQEVSNYDKTDVSSFDSWAFKFSETGYEKAGTISDYFAITSTLAPFFLLLDDEIRHNWADFITLYTETQLTQSMLYLGAAFPIRKARPFVYNTNLSPEDRSGDNATNSFFSGHTSTAATGTFFMAKVYADYHDLSTLQQVLLYTGAAIPPAVVGYYRMKAGKHFTSDVLTGFAVGALSGILIPELHKITPKELSLLPVYNEHFKGLSMSLTLK
ncbi:MAG: phosphatase PAP2 family protein [Reichenbachiella sp.]